MRGQRDCSGERRSEDKVLAIRPADLDDFYLTASDYDKNNLFFVLLNSMLHYEDGGGIVAAAHLNFLAAYYLFNALTPPGSQSLALHYINRAKRKADRHRPIG